MGVFGLRESEEEKVVGVSERYWRMGREWCMDWRVFVAMEERESRERERCCGGGV